MSQPLETTAAHAATLRARPSSLFQGAVLGAFSDMKLGRMRLELPDGTTREFGSADGPPLTFDRANGERVKLDERRARTDVKRPPKTTRPS